MGVGRRQSLGEFAVKVGAYASVGQPQADRKGVEQSALLVTKAARSSIRAGSGGDSILSNVGRGARVGARYDIEGAANPTALVRATGPLHLLDNPTRAHQITPKVKKGRSRASRAAFYNAIFGGEGGFGGTRPMRTPYGPRYRVNHPGTRGKRTFFRAVDAAKPFVKVAFIDGQRKSLRRYFG
jgi:hypothetical protein